MTVITSYLSPSVKLTDMQEQKLLSLYTAAIMTEQVYDQECKEFVNSFFDKQFTQKNHAHGDYIKEYYKILHGTSQMQTTGTLPGWFIQFLAEICRDVASDSPIVDQVGLNNIYQEVVKQVSSGSNDYAYGNLIEISDVAQFVTTLQHRINELIAINGYHYQVRVIDTSPKSNFNKSVLYDIELEVIDTNTGQIINLPPMEVKTGINANYQLSHFHFGKFSSEGLTWSPQLYQDLIENLRESFKEFIKGVSTRSFARSVYSIILDWCIIYIDWKLRMGEFPIFVGKGEYHINLSSEIIKGFLTGNPGGEVEVVINELFEFLLTPIVDKLGKRLRANTKNNNILNETYDYDTKVWQNNGLFMQDVENMVDLIFNMFTGNIMPDFSANVWYGRR